ncbi:MAG: hypothetical protein QW812_04675 [Thermoplasmataceae archaeon]
MDVLSVAAIVLSVIAIGFSTMVYASLVQKLRANKELSAVPAANESSADQAHNRETHENHTGEVVASAQNQRPGEIENLEKFLYSLSVEIQKFSSSVSKNIDNISTRIGMKSTVRPIQFNMDAGKPQVVDSVSHDEHEGRP